MELNDEFNELIKKFYFENRGNGIIGFLKCHPDIDQYLSKIIEEKPWFESKRMAFCLFGNGIYDVAKCVVCGKELEASKARRGIRCCSIKCGNNDPYSMEKRKATNIKKYGCDNPLSNKLVREKIKKTMVDRYGVENALESKKFLDKMKRNNLRKYGAEYILQLQSTREKSKNTCLEKYGVEHPMLNKDFVENVKRHNVEKYGVTSTTLIKEVRDKQKKTCLEKYGNICSLCNEEVKKKSVKTMRKNYGVDHPMKSKEIRERASGSELSKSFDNVMERWRPYVIPLFEKNDYQGFDKPFEYKWKCSKCGNEFSQRIYVTGLGDDRYVPRCPVCFPKKESICEQEFACFIKSIYDGEIIEHDRNMINPLELDIYLPDMHIAFEFDGEYWHTEENGKDSNYHLSKTKMCANAGIRLIHVFDSEWIDHRNIVEDRIKSIMGIDQTRIYARKCKTLEIDAKTSNEFLENNHIQGGDSSSVRYGLYQGDELVAVMTFGKPRFNEKYDWELIRFASKNGISIAGGASKLLSCFTSSHSGSIVSYADKRWSDGNLYEKIGFEKTGESKPNYHYIKGINRLSRYQCQKHLLADVLGDGFNPLLSESENMKNNGWKKVFDCGNIIYVYHIKN